MPVRSQKARETAWTGMLFALAIALSYLESLVSPLLGLMPAIKLGLSNIVVMYALLFLRTRTALLLVVLKALFAFLTRGATAGFLSLCGGALSLAVMLVLLQLPVSGYIFCAGSALAHNLGQLAGALGHHYFGPFILASPHAPVYFQSGGHREEIAHGHISQPGAYAVGERFGQYRAEAVIEAEQIVGDGESYRGGGEGFRYGEQFMLILSSERLYGGLRYHIAVTQHRERM